MVYIMKLSEGITPTEAATKQDIQDLGDKLVWPPAFTRDIRLKKMQNMLNKEEEVMRDPTLSDAEKVLRVAEYKQQYNVQDKELFEPGRLGAVPSKPLTKPATKSSKTDPGIESDVDSDVSDETVIDLSEYEDLPEDDDGIDDDQVGSSPAALIQMVAPYRRQKAQLMLKKLAADGRLKWDHQGKVYYNGKVVPGSNIQHLVQYFQTAHKKNPMPQPQGKNIFAQALRRAHALDDVLLGGDEDNNVRQIFRGHSPKTPGFPLRKSHYGKARKHGKPGHSALSSPDLSRPLKRRREEDIKTVIQLEL